MLWGRKRSTFYGNIYKFNLSSVSFVMRHPPTILSHFTTALVYLSVSSSLQCCTVIARIVNSIQLKRDLRDIVLYCGSKQVDKTNLTRILASASHITYNPFSPALLLLYTCSHVAINITAPVWEGNNSHTLNIFNSTVVKFHIAEHWTKTAKQTALHQQFAVVGTYCIDTEY